MPPPIDLTGRPVGRLTVLRLAPREDWPRGLRAWICRCDCGREEVINTSQLTGKSRRRESCLVCSGSASRADQVEKTCLACGRKFTGHFNSKTCSKPCRQARRRGRDAGVEALPPPMAECVICGASYHHKRGIPRCCSPVCRREFKRRRARENWYHRLEKDPDLPKRMHQRRKERAAADPEYAAKVASWERIRYRRHRKRMRTDPEYAARYRAATNAYYRQNAEVIQAGRQARLDALSSEELDAWLERARAYGRRYRRRWRAELAKDPAAHQRYRDLMREYRRRRARRRLEIEAARLAAELESRHGDTDALDPESPPEA